MPKVFLIAQPTVDREGKMPKLRSLADHGEIVVIIRDGSSPTVDPEGCLTEIMDKLRTFDPREDVLAWVGGDTLAAVLTGVALERLGHGNVTWLRYDRGKTSGGQWTHEGSRYFPVKVSLSRRSVP